MTAELARFLRDRFDDDARVALDASGFTVVEDAGQWAASPAGDEWEAARTDCDEDELLVALRPGLARPPEVMSGLWGAIVSDVPDLSQQPGSASVLPQLVHAARHDPARVLAEVDAKRRILAIHRRYVDEPGQACLGCAGGIEWEACPIVPLLALPYQEHPDYPEEWKL